MLHQMYSSQHDKVVSLQNELLRLLIYIVCHNKDVSIGSL